MGNNKKEQLKHVPVREVNNATPTKKRTEHKEKQKKTPVSSICRKRADYFCPGGRQLKPRKSEIRKALFRNDSSHAIFADDGERRVFSGKAELFAA